MADTLETIDAALASIDAELLKPKAVQYGDRSRTSRSTEELMIARTVLLRRRSALVPTPRQVIGVSSKGIW